MAISFFPEGNIVQSGDNELRVLMKIADDFSGGGGGGGGVGASILWIYWEATHANDNPPPNPSFSYMRRFRDGDNPVVWDPSIPAWV